MEILLESIRYEILLGIGGISVLVSSLVCAVVARKRDGSIFLWALLGAFFGLLALIPLFLFVKPPEQKDGEE
jgi:hypothetical protein